ncbi:tail fiber protein [Pantoea phage vB_PagS_MED16]|nr:tail fiber protein [Pantoea phage vB_PagS_MED16]
MENKALAVTGSKGGGGSPSTPKEAADSLHSVSTIRILLGLGEGEFDISEVSPKTIMLNNTPLQNPDGSWNYPDVRWEVRAGTQTQEPIAGFPAVESETEVGTSLRYGTPWVQSFNNLAINAVSVRIGFPSLFSQDAKTGDVNGTTVRYHIDVQTDGGAFQTVGNFELTGKTTTGNYERSHRIDLPKATTGWQVRVVRDTPDSTSSRLGNDTTMKAYVQIVDAKLRYPHTALLYVEFDAKQFQNIPKISVLTRGRIIRVPNNYDPVSRTYNSTWDGGFKWAWTNNPAWIFYDLCAEPRFGIGKRMQRNGIPMVDKWELYRIGQRCDQMVPDGRGGNGTEPRFTLDVYIASRAEAWQVVNDLAAVFAGMMWWGGGQLNVQSDMPGDIAHIITRASVIGGKIIYNSGSQRNRFSTFVVNYCDPNNHYQDRPAAGQIIDLVKRYGANQLEMTAIGCTRETEAQRRGQWALYTNSFDRTASWKVGIEGLAYRPGQIVALADERLAGRVMGGRVGEGATRQNITTDCKTDAAAGDTFIVRTKSGNIEKQAITKVTQDAAGNSVLFLGVPLSSDVEPDSVFVIDSGQLALQMYRVTSVRYNPEDNNFDCAGVVYMASKYDVIDRGARLDERPISLIDTGTIAAPKNIIITSYEALIQSQRITTMRVDWDAVLGEKTAAGTIGGAVAYEAQWRRNSNDWINIQRTGLTSFEVPGIYEGDYYVRVRAINAGEASSIWADAVMVHLSGRQGDVPAPIGLAAAPLLYGIAWSWAFGPDSDDTLLTELSYRVPGDATERHLTNESYPSTNYQQMGITPGQRVFVRARCQDRMGNLSPWTDWVEGQSNADADDYLAGIASGFLTDKDGQQLTEQLQGNFEMQMQTLLNQGYIIDEQMAQYGNVKAAVAQMKKVQADANRAFAEFQTVVTAQLGEQYATIQQKMTSIFDAETGGEAMYSLNAGVKYNGQYYDAGMVISVVADGAGYRSRIGLNADQFVLLSGQGDVTYSPFSVINGVVFINTALIGKATIDGAQIKDATIRSAHIQDSIQSDTWTNSGGAYGWRISKTQGFQFIGQTSRNVRLDDTGLGIYDSAGIERFKAGFLG